MFLAVGLQAQNFARVFVDFVYKMKSATSSCVGLQAQNFASNTPKSASSAGMSKVVARLI